MLCQFKIIFLKEHEKRVNSSNHYGNANKNCNKIARKMQIKTASKIAPHTHKTTREMNVSEGLEMAEALRSNDREVN